MAGENTQEASDRLGLLQDEISRLDQHEKMLDEHKQVNCYIGQVNGFNFNIFTTVGAAEYSEYPGRRI